MSQFGSVLYVICVSFICACHSLVDILGGKAYTSCWAPMLQPGRGQHGNNLIVLSMLANISEEKKKNISAKAARLKYPQNQRVLFRNNWRICRVI